jgi:DNA-binding CsgD family transcriptional regulator
MHYARCLFACDTRTIVISLFHRGESVAEDLPAGAPATLDLLCSQTAAWDDERPSTLLAARDEEIAALGALLHDCRQGNGIVAVIRGPVASGKSTVLHAFTQHAAMTGAIVLGAVGSRAERGLPLGIVDQLFRPGSLPVPAAEKAADLIEVHALTGAQPQPETINPATARVFEGLLAILAELSERHPVVLAVDDLQHADVASLQCLSYLARRASTSAILTVLTECAQALPADRLLHAEILRQWNCTCIPLAPLSRAAVASLLSKHLDPITAERLASSCYVLTGGNPLLVQALGEDARASGTEPAVLNPQDAFRSAVVTCLHRYEPGTVEFVQALAVLGENATPDLVAGLLGISAESAVHKISALNASGLLGSGRFRHEAARHAVLEHMTTDERAAMRGRAARTLYKAGAAPAILAAHLLDVHLVGARWTVPVLQDAAERALAEGDAGRAITYLRRAECESADDRQRAAIRFALACAEWPVNPEGATRHLAELAADARADRLDEECKAKLTYYLLWLGDTDSAAEILGTTDIEQVVAKADRAGLQAHHIRSPLNFLYPDSATRARAAAADRKLGSVRDAAVEAAPVVAERILRERGLNDPTLASVTTALMTLICEDMLDRAAFWCDALMGGSGPDSGGILRRAVLTGFRAIIETRWGNLETAENDARAALALLTRKAWGVVIGVPLSSLLLSTIASRKLGEAAECLQVPVPGAMFRTPYGLLYLYARGEYHLATGSARRALADFMDCGNRMIEWGLDQPGLVPWRTKAAEAYLAIGDSPKASELSREQLAQAGSRPSRTRGLSLRALALTTHPSKRTALLRESAEILRDSGARLELAYTFNDLSNAYQALGEHSRAHWAARQARNLAERCGARALNVALHETELGVPETGDGTVAQFSRLSDAEQRVAALAACGYKNNQIAHKLFITVSTVEQHLTRVYRKLGVAGRAELPIKIEPRSPNEPAARVNYAAATPWPY